MSNFKGFRDIQYSDLATWTEFSGCSRSKINPQIGMNVAFDIHASQMVIIKVRAGCHILSACQSEVGDNSYSASPFPSGLSGLNASKTAGAGAKQLDDLVGTSSAKLGAAEGIGELYFVQLVIAAK